MKLVPVDGGARLLRIAALASVLGAVLVANVSAYAGAAGAALAIGFLVGSLVVRRPPITGARHRVEAYRGTPDGVGRLFVNTCGGSLRLLAMPEPRLSIPLAMSPVLAAAVATIHLWLRTRPNDEAEW